MSSWSSSRAAAAHQFPALARRRARVAAARSARVRSGARLSHQVSYRAVTASRSCGLTDEASPRVSLRMVISRAPRARAMRAEPWPMTCRARSRSRVPPASRRARDAVPLVTARTMGAPVVARRRTEGGPGLGAVTGRVPVLISALRLGLAARWVRGRLVCAAGGIEGPGDLGHAEAGAPSGGGQGVQVSGRVGVQGAVGGPEQAGVAVAFGLAGDPAGQVADVLDGGRAGSRR